jgi:multimeric flavodoxin WrbA
MFDYDFRLRNTILLENKNRGKRKRKFMKTVAFNGSPNKNGNTYHALRMVTEELEKEGIETEILHVGNKAIRGCLACGQCIKKQNEQCVQLNNFLCYTEMLLPSSNYWNVIHGTRPGEATQDEEGRQIMRTLGRNMAWLMKLVEHGKGTIAPPEKEGKIFMNFIR